MDFVGGCAARTPEEKGGKEHVREKRASGSADGKGDVDVPPLRTPARLARQVHRCFPQAVPLMSCHVVCHVFDAMTVEIKLFGGLAPITAFDFPLYDSLKPHHTNSEVERGQHLSTLLCFLFCHVFRANLPPCLVFSFSASQRGLL